MRTRASLIVALLGVVAGCTEHTKVEPRPSEADPPARRSQPVFPYARGKLRKEEVTGNVPRFDGHPLHPHVVIEPLDGQDLPIVLPLEVQRDVIQLGGSSTYVGGSRLRFRRAGEPQGPASIGGALIPVRGDDSWLVWHDVSTTGESQIEAARTSEPERSAVVLEYPPDQAIGDPHVVGDRVAIVLTTQLLHAPLAGGETLALALPGPPKTLASARPTSDGRRLVWLARHGARELILGVDARFETVEVLFDQPDTSGSLSAAAPVGDSLVFVNVDWSTGIEKDKILRLLPDGTIVEVLPHHFHRDDLRLLPDGEQAWLYREGMTWWIGPRSHSFYKVLDSEASAIAADDGLLVWQQLDGVWVSAGSAPGSVGGSGWTR